MNSLHASLAITARKHICEQIYGCFLEWCLYSSRVLLIFFSSAMLHTCPILSLVLDNLILVPSYPLSWKISYMSYPVPRPCQPYTCPILSIVLANLKPLPSCPHPEQLHTCLILSLILTNLIPVPSCPLS